MFIEYITGYPNVLSSPIYHFFFGRQRPTYLLVPRQDELCVRTQSIHDPHPDHFHDSAIETRAHVFSRPRSHSNLLYPYLSLFSSNPHRLQVFLHDMPMHQRNGGPLVATTCSSPVSGKAQAR